jgi:3-hydroxyisobutyrate dehydrogenase
MEGMRPGGVYVDLSSSSPALIRTISERMAERGCVALDAPISGGVTGAENGTLQVMVGGDAATYERIRPVLLQVGSKVSRMGEVGAGTVAKLAHNLAYIAARSVLAECFTLGTKGGVEPQALLEAFRGSAFGQGMMLSHFLPEMVFQGRFEPVRFAMKLAHKDVALATGLARELDVPMALGALTEQLLVEAMARGWGDRDYGTAFLLQEERAGVQVRTGSKPAGG